MFQLYPSFPSCWPAPMFSVSGAMEDVGESCWKADSWSAFIQTELERDERDPNRHFLSSTLWKEMLKYVLGMPHHSLGGGFKYFSDVQKQTYLGEKIPNLTSIFFKWVETAFLASQKCITAHNFFSLHRFFLFVAVPLRNISVQAEEDEVSWWHHLLWVWSPWCIVVMMIGLV